MAYYEFRANALGDSGLGDAASTEAMISGLDIELAVVRDEIQKKLNAGQNNTPEFNTLTNRLTDVMNRREQLAQKLATERAAEKAAVSTNVGVNMQMTSGAGATATAPNAAPIISLPPIFTQPPSPRPAASGLSTGAWVGIGVGSLAVLTLFGVMLSAPRRSTPSTPSTPKVG